MPQDPVIFYITSSNGFSLQTSIVNDPIIIQKQANFAEQEVINRSSPIITFGSSGAMTLSITLKFVALGTNGLMNEDVNNIAKALTSLTFPVNSGINPPPACTITIGNNTLITNWQCVCASCQIVIAEHNLYDENGNPSAISAVLQFKGFETQSVDAADWAQNSLSSYQQLSF